MRHLPIICCAALAVAALWWAAAPGFAKSDPGADRADLTMEARVRALEAEVAYLRSRESATSAYVLANGARGEALTSLAATMRAQGFAQRALPARSRETLLRGLTAMGAELQLDLPAPTKEDLASLKWLDKHVRLAPRVPRRVVNAPLSPTPVPGTPRAETPEPAPAVPQPAPSVPDTSGN